MRSISIGAICYVLLIAAFIAWGPLSKPAVAQPGITIGFVVDGSGLVSSSEKGEKLALYLEQRLRIPVKMRSFATENQLFNWLTRFREVDIAWLSQDFLQAVPSGKIYPLVNNRTSLKDLPQGDIVARQGISNALRQQIRDVLLGMNETPDGREVLSELGTSKFSPPPLWQTPGWQAGSQKPQDAAVTQPETGSREDKEWPAASAKEAVAIKPRSRVADTVALTSPAEKQTSTETETAPPASLQEQVKDTPGQGAGETAKDVPTVTPETGSESVGKEDERRVDDAVKDEIALVADYLAYNADEDSYEARGDVVLRQAGVELKSEELMWQSATQDASARGGVQLDDAGTKVSADQIQYNMATGQGQISQGRVFVREGNFHLAGEEIEKHGQAAYFVRNGSFTTCDGDIPDWSFSAGEVDVTLGGYARAKNVTFNVKGVPVFYSPYLFFPVKTERESGLLTPWFGYSNNKGVRASMAWYQVIDRHLDATIYLDYLSEIGLGKGLEYRYALAKQNNGELLYYHVTGFNETPDLYYLEWQHHGNLPGGWRMTADFEYANKQLFFDEYGEVAEDYNRDKTVSILMLQRNWQKLNLVTHARYIKDFEEDNDATLQRLPELGLSLARYRFRDTPVYLGLEGYATRFWREQGEDGERLYLRPSVSAVFSPGGWLEMTPEVALYERLYSANAGDEESLVPEFSLLLATRLVKDFTFEKWGFERLQHSIEPEVAYTYVPYEDQEGIPVFDLLDRIEERNDVTYALVNRFTARATDIDDAKVYRELLNLRLSQSYDIDEARNNVSGENQPFSDIRLELDANPAKYFSLDIESLIPVYGDLRFRTLTAGAEIKDETGNALRANYTYRDESEPGTATDYAKLEVATSLLKPVYLRFEERYDFRQQRELEKVVGLEYRAKCWSLLLTYRNRYQEDGDDDHEVMLNFVLAGLGQNTGFGGSFENN